MTVKVSQIANIYAEALMALDLDKSLLKNDLSNILETITEEMYSTFDNPAIPNSVKIEILNTVFKDKIDNKILEFLKLLIEKNRIIILDEIYTAYNQKFNKQNNIQNVTIVSAINLDESYKTCILEIISKKIKKQIQPNWVISEDIIGGLIIKIDDTVIDTSIKYKLEQLKKQI